MEVLLSAELQARLARVAQERGTDAQTLAREAIERLVDYDDWFVREVEKGLAQIEAGHTLTHEDVGVRLKKHLTGKPPRRQCSFDGRTTLQTILNASPLTSGSTHRTALQT